MIYNVNGTEVAEYFCIDLSKWDVVLFGEAFAILIFRNGLDERAIEISAFRLDRAPLCFDLYKIATQFDPVGRREPNAESRSFGEEEFNKLVTTRSRAEYSDLRWLVCLSSCKLVRERHQARRVQRVGR